MKQVSMLVFFNWKSYSLNMCHMLNQNLLKLHSLELSEFSVLVFFGLHMFLQMFFHAPWLLQSFCLWCSHFVRDRKPRSRCFQLRISPYQSMLRIESFKSFKSFQSSSQLCPLIDSPLSTGECKKASCEFVWHVLPPCPGKVATAKPLSGCSFLSFKLFLAMKLRRTSCRCSLHPQHPGSRKDVKDVHHQRSTS